ncbi:MAG TPA: hypothetical protein VFS62_05305 [Chloroflexota bacterium]|jgi:hypothetical protein|nr:hypothetical protein [Chloroflexota bacterium]
MVRAAPLVSHSGGRVWLRWLAASTLLAADLLLSAGLTYACDTPVDAASTTSRVLRATRPVLGPTSLSRENTPFFLAHKAIALGLDGAGCSPEAGGLQWVKAAAHTVRQDRAQEVVRGLKGDARRSSSPSTLAAELCGYLGTGAAAARQQQELAAAGLPCP